MLWETHMVLAGQEEGLIQRFLMQVDAAYREILSELEKEDADLVTLSRKYQQVQAQDYFHSELGKQVRTALMTVRGEDEL